MSLRSAKPVLRVLLAGVMVSVGILHFTSPSGFEKIVPSFLPSPRLLVFVSGACEILGGLGLLHPRTRRLAGIGLIALYVAVFPANINMAVNDLQPEGHPIPTALLWLRLPFQLLFIAWAAWTADVRSRSRPTDS
jgi:uncharacterized membrane protein